MNAAAPTNHDYAPTTPLAVPPAVPPERTQRVLRWPFWQLARLVFFVTGSRNNPHVVEWTCHHEHGRFHSPWMHQGRCVGVNCSKCKSYIITDGPGNGGSISGRLLAALTSRMAGEGSPF